MNITMGGSGKITVDGKTFTGNNVSIVNGQVIVDGKTQDGSLTGPLPFMVMCRA